MFKIDFEVFGAEVKDGSNRKLGFIQIPGGRGLNITPELLISEKPELQGQAIWGFNAHIEADNDKLNLQVKGFEYFTIAARGTVNIEYMKVFNCSDFFRLNRLSIERIDVEESNLLLVDSEVTEINVGIETVFIPSEKKVEISKLKPLKLDVRDSVVKQIRIFVPHREINIQQTSCRRFILEKSSATSNLIRIWQDSKIDRVVLSKSIGELKIMNSIISDLEFSPACTVQKIDLQSSCIHRTYNCTRDTIVEKNLGSRKLIMDSAASSNNSSLYASAAYDYMEQERNVSSNPLIKCIYKFIQLSCGYGYRPLYTVVFSVLTFFAFGIFYWILGIINMGGVVLRTTNGDQAVHGLSGLGYSLYFSVITFTTVGYGDVIPIGLPARTLAGLEAILGISLLAILIFSLTRRYGGFR